jgi:hypothetical protein
MTMIPETEMIEIIDNKTYDRPELTQYQRFVDFKLWMTFVNRLNRDDLTTQLFPHELQFDENTIVKPNIFICENDKPMLIVEANHCDVKFAKYQAVGVPEYWVVDQSTNLVTTNVLVDDRYFTTTYHNGDAVPISFDEQLFINVEKVFRIDYSDENTSEI